MFKSPLLLSGVTALGLVFAGAAYAQEFIARIGHLESAAQSRHVHLEKVA